MKQLFSIILFLISFLSVNAQVNTDRVMDIGRNALYYEDYILAIQYFNMVVKAKPYLAEPYYFRAIAKYSLDDIKGAEEDCSLCIDRNPFITNAYQLRGDTRQRLEDYKGANEDYTKALVEMPGNKFLLVNLGIVNIEMKNYKEADSYLDELTKLYPTYNAGYMARAALHLEQKDTTAAIESYSKAIEADKYFAQTYTQRGMLYLQLKQNDKALKDLDEAIKIDPSVGSNYINRGLIRYYKNDLRGAMSDYDKVIDIDPNNTIARFNRGLLRAQVADNNRAIEDFNVVIQNEPENIMAYYNRSILRNSIGDYKNALQDLNVVMKKYSDYSQGYYYRADLEKKAGNMVASERDYNYARSLEQANQRKLSTKEGRKAVENKEKARQTDREKTREKSNDDIDKFNLLVVSDKKDEEKSKFASTIRGRVQDRQVKIELLPKFVISFYESSFALKHFIYYSDLLDNLNRNENVKTKLYLTNNETALTEEQITANFELIDNYTKLIAQKPKNAIAYYVRGIAYSLVQDYTNAVSDFRSAINLDSKFALAYFSLSSVITKQLDMRHTGSEYEAKSSQNLSPSLLGSNGKPSSITEIKENTVANQDKIDLDVIMDNYNKVITIAPKFKYGYYNRAEIKATLKDYKGAIADYDTVIKIDPESADAYFNRGLCKLSIHDTDNGLDDLRRAGEFGIVESYSIIKRMTNQ